jgi:predicted ribosomally synthesized peptide with SipW-like signal peptide
VASAGAGLGTSAYFSDTETFEDNSLTAGELDMVVGYTAHYSDWSEDEAVDLDGDVSMEDPTEPIPENATDIGLPTNAAPLISVEGPDDAEQFLNNTQTGAFPDDDENDGEGDGVQDQLSCADRSQADDAPVVIELDDVKPGDFGEVTFDFVLCDNPGFVWLDGSLVSASENGLTEPEADDPDEDGDADSTDPGDVELLDAVQAAVWIDDGNNYQNGDEQPIEVGSIRDILALLDEGDLGVQLDGDLPASEGGGMSDTNCFSASTQHSVVFAWWLPVDHANEIQTDTATFDLSFYTEQCRHNDGSGQAAEKIVVQSPATGGVRETDNWITATVEPGPTTTVTVELDGEVYGNEPSEWPNNENSYFIEANFDVDNDGLGESQADDFRIGYAAAGTGQRSNAIANSTSGATGDGGYIRRNTGTGSPNRTDTAEEDVSGFTATESSDQLTYTLEIDWTSDDLPDLSSPPSSVVLNEVFGGDGGEGVGATPNSSNDGRGDVDTVAPGTGPIDLNT